ncbi:BspA family leucine-rich repeat surface protein [Leyella stercorea]|mgnify:FL=1|uniref:BspA family leucine-rich repeat surface protein n=3 Tax=Leyella stercorea TaxID=363265 RepID=UPI0034A38FAA
MFAQTAESYVVLDNAAGTLTFKHDANKPAGAFSLNEGELYPAWYAMAGDHTGYNENNIKKVVFDSSFANARPTNCCFWFVGCKDLTVIEGLEYLNTEKVTSMRSMFASCTNLTSLDVSKFRTQNVTDMYYMFGDCSSLTSLDVSKFDTRNVTDMDYMFNNCSNLTSLDVSKFDTQNVTSMWTMFKGCSSLTSLDLSNFDTQNVTNMYGMFYGCVNLATIYASDKFVTTACSEDCEIFGNCKKLVGAVPYDPNRIGKEMANYTTGYFTYKAASGIDAVSATDNIAAEYYDVNGRRLNAPQKGINIVKRGNRTTKVLVK